MLDVRDLGMEESGGSRQVRWKAWGHPSQQINSPPSLHTAHSSSLAWVCAERYWSYVGQQQKAAWMLYPIREWLPLVANGAHNSFRRSFGLLWLLTRVKHPIHLYTAFGYFGLKKKKEKAWPDVNFLSTFEGGGQIDTTRKLASCLLVGAKHLLDIEPLTGFMFNWQLSRRDRGRRQSGCFLGWGGHHPSTCGAIHVKHACGMKYTQVCSLGNKSLLVPDVPWLAGFLLFTLYSFILTPRKKRHIFK